MFRPAEHLCQELPCQVLADIGCLRGENSPIPWLQMLDDYGQRIKALEERVQKCAETKPWICGSETQHDLLELVDRNLSMRMSLLHCYCLFIRNTAYCPTRAS